jgi:peptide/nickel transport system substrate-binding protein
MKSGGASETLDPNLIYVEIDTARCAQIFEPAFVDNDKGEPEPLLATDATANSDGTTWKVRFRDDVTFHDGKPFTAKDAAWTYNWILNEKNGSYGRGDLLGAGMTKVRALDDTTIEITLSRPNFILSTFLVRSQLALFQDGTHPGKGGKFVGTGPFKFESFKPGERSVMSANKDYWQSDRPYLDRVEIISFADTSGLADAIQTDQVDVVSGISYQQLSTLENAAGVSVESAPSGYFNTHIMNCQAEPYNDPRVRQAMRLLIDRDEQLSNALVGQGKLANDLFSWFDPLYADFDQRAYDPEQAMSLLRDAGKADFPFELATGDVGPGLVESATLFAQEAVQAGINLKVKKVPSDQYFTVAYLKVPFYGSYWPGVGFPVMCTATLTKDASFPETSWNNTDWDQLFYEGLASSDEAGRKSKMEDAQRMLFDEGGYVIPTFNNAADASRTAVGGLVASPVGPLGNFDFRGTFIAS